MNILKKLDFIAKHGKKVPDNLYHKAINKALNSENYFFRVAAIQHPNATKEHIDKALNDKYGYIRAAAIQHPNATKEHLDKALKDEDYSVRDIAKERLSNQK